MISGMAQVLTTGLCHVQILLATVQSDMTAIKRCGLFLNQVIICMLDET
jgi:hypothetical protein